MLKHQPKGFCRGHILCTMWKSHPPPQQTLGLTPSNMCEMGPCEARFTIRFLASLCQRAACARLVGDSHSSRPRPSARRCWGGWCRGRATCCCAATDKETETERERGIPSHKRKSGCQGVSHSQKFLLEFTTEGGLSRVEEAGCKQPSLRVDRGELNSVCSYLEAASSDA